MFGWRQNISKSVYFASWGKIDTGWVIQKYWWYWHRLSAMKNEKHRCWPKKTYWSSSKHHMEAIRIWGVINWVKGKKRLEALFKTHKRKKEVPSKLFHYFSVWNCKAEPSLSAEHENYIQISCKHFSHLFKINKKTWRPFVIKIFLTRVFKWCITNVNSTCAH